MNKLKEELEMYDNKLKEQSLEELKNNIEKSVDHLKNTLWTTHSKYNASILSDEQVDFLLAVPEVKSRGKFKSSLIKPRDESKISNALDNMTKDEFKIGDRVMTEEQLLLAINFMAKD